MVNGTPHDKYSDNCLNGMETLLKDDTGVTQTVMECIMSHMDSPLQLCANS